MNNKDIEVIAHDLISAKIKAGKEVHMPWAVQELIKTQGEIRGKGREFYSFCTQEHVYRVVKKCVDKYDHASADADRNQMALEGFEYLQAAYTVDRDNERVLVPIDLLDDDELLGRADQYDTLAAGLEAHANELRGYVKKRQVDVPA